MSNSSANILKKLAGQTAIYGISSIVGRMLNWLLVPLHTRIFAEADYGIVTELYGYVAFFAILYTYGMETAYFRYVKDADKQPETVYNTAFAALGATAIVFSALLIGFAHPIADLLDYGQHPEYIVYFALVLAFDTIVAIPFAQLRYEEKAVQFATFRLINIAINIGLNLFFFVLCPRMEGEPLFDALYDPSVGIGYIFLSNFIASFVTFLLLVPYMAKATLLTKTWKILDGQLLRQMLLYALPLLVVGFAGTINEMLDRVLFKQLYPADPQTTMQQLGIYGACYRICIIMSLFTQAYRFAAEPFFFAQSNRDDAQQVYANSMKYFFITGLLVLVGVSFFMDIVKWLIGSRYHAGLGVVPILLLSHLLLGVYYNLSVWYKLTNRTTWGAIIAVGGALLTLVLNILLIPIMGYWGAALTNLACYALMTIVSYIWGQKHYPIPYQTSRLLAYMAIAIGLVGFNNTVLHTINMPIAALYSLKIALLLLFIGGIYGYERKTMPKQAI
jgi:O-antigen/teichoic acid export membrane protein